MTGPGLAGPFRGLYTVRCEVCAALAYTSDTEPPADRDAELRRFADNSCPRDGLGCPHVAAAVEQREQRRPEWLAALIQAARARLGALEDRAPRSRSVMLPALAANTPVEVPVTWPSPMPSAGYQVAIGQEFAALVLLGKIEAAVKAGSRTPAGCTLLVAASRDVDAGQAGLHVIATP